MNESAVANAISFEKELVWLDKLFRYREFEWKKERLSRLPGSGPDMNSADSRFADLSGINSVWELFPELPSPDESPYAGFLHHYHFSPIERTALLLALLPHITPGLLEQYNLNFNNEKWHCPEFGMKKTDSGSGLPSWNTLFFLLAGASLPGRANLHGLFSDDHFFNRHAIVQKANQRNRIPEADHVLSPETDIIDLFMLGHIRPPEFSKDFPAKYITTEMDWEDLVLAPVTRKQVEEVKVWMKHRTRLLDELGMRKRIHHGYKILFYGPPGTGKTLTALLLGKFIGKEVFRIDLSSVVSKYIGETEKNLAKVFDKAAHSDWILFFDEADALFGSRTKVSSSHDRYANQEVSYLLQRIEDYPGIVILATNMKNNIDDAFARRFQSMVHFPFPKADERFLLWQKAFPEQLRMDDIDFRKVAEKFEMTGGQITNIVAWCSLMALEKGDDTVTEASLRDGVARELAKEGRTL